MPSVLTAMARSWAYATPEMDRTAARASELRVREFIVTSGVIWWGRQRFPRYASWRPELIRLVAVGDLARQGSGPLQVHNPLEQAVTCPLPLSRLPVFDFRRGLFFHLGSAIAQETGHVRHFRSGVVARPRKEERSLLAHEPECHVHRRDDGDRRRQR